MNGIGGMDAEAAGVEWCWGKSGFYLAPQIFKSPYFSEYTNGEPLITNFRFIDPPNKQTKNKSHFGAVSQQRLILQLLTLSGV